MVPTCFPSIVTETDLSAGMPLMVMGIENVAAATACGVRTKVKEAIIKTQNNSLLVVAEDFPKIICDIDPMVAPENT